MISSPLLYLFTLAFIAVFFHLLQKNTKFKIWNYLPVVVLIYASSMFLATIGLFEANEAINSVYTLTKTNLLPAMLFLMLLGVDFSQFLKLGKSLLIAYFLAIFSLACGFIIVAFFFDFNHEIASAFGALAGSWMGGTANMIAVGSALGVSHEAFGFVLIVDSVNYTLWLMLLLFLLPFAPTFNKFMDAHKSEAILSQIGCACNMGAKKYWSLLLLSLLVSLSVQLLAAYVKILDSTTTMVLLATLFGVLGSFTRLKNLGGANEIASSMLYMLIALIGSKALLENFEEVGIFVFAGFMILLIHALIMLLGAKIFKLDLFSIAVASLANIGGIASAPILAATYNKALVSVGVLMAVMGYLIGTFGGLIVGKIMISLAQ